MWMQRIADAPGKGVSENSQEEARIGTHLGIAFLCLFGNQEEKPTRAGPCIPSADVFVSLLVVRCSEHGKPLICLSADSAN